MIGDLQRRNINAAFDTLDVTGDDHIDQDDFRVRVDRLRTLRPDMDEKLACELRDTFDAWWEIIRRAADSDGDGRVTREEFTAAIDAGLEEDPAYIDQMVRVAQAVADAADRDGDGMLDRSELDLIYKAFDVDVDFSEETFRRLDRDGDGLFSTTEWAQTVRDMFSSTDRATAAAIAFGPVPK
ncbi:EF-hand domain-containing protein [Streptomyces sp. NBC_00299]|uniref:EF-hand domain-containing protein n=1 Tax=Streptomyces sp. NBC_00299 TaxID=2975705 RepID=UPI002E2807CE|nr:EF-hand domain-containing protein [Streptomyces sp. NBC_00299]